MGKEIIREIGAGARMAAEIAVSEIGELSKKAAAIATNPIARKIETERAFRELNKRVKSQQRERQKSRKSPGVEFIRKYSEGKKRYKKRLRDRNADAIGNNF